MKDLRRFDLKLHTMMDDDNYQTLRTSTNRCVLLKTVSHGTNVSFVMGNLVYEGFMGSPGLGHPNRMFGGQGVVDWFSFWMHHTPY